MPIAGYILTALLAYLLGSIPTGFLVAKARGVDIRSVGSGNIGATNVLRHLGVPAGVFVLAADVAKGWVAVTVAGRVLASWFGAAPESTAREWFAIVAAICAVLGHNYTCWLHFKGGKGIATSAGVLLALVPWALVVSLIVFGAVLVLSRFASLSSICASAVLPFATWLTKESRTLIVVTAAMAVLAIYRHKANIKRLLAGTENRLGAPKPVPAPAKPDS